MSHPHARGSDRPKSSGMAAVCMVLLLIGGCSFNSGANAGRRCSAGCESGQVCYRGFCVAGDAATLDADVGVMDTGVDTGDDTGAPDVGPSDTGPDAMPLDALPPCDGGRVCDRVCVDVMSDDRNCGGCRITCMPDAGERCLDGVCCANCGGPDVCVDLNNSDTHCGMCGMDCGLRRCFDGRCCVSLGMGCL